MRLKTDLLEHPTAKDIREAAENLVHRFKPEPNYSETGVRCLSSASTEERANEVKHSMALTRKLERRAQLYRSSRRLPAIGFATAGNEALTLQLVDFREEILFSACQ